MKTRTQWLVIGGFLVALTVAFLAGGIFVNSVFAQGPWQGGFGGMHGAMQNAHNNQALFDLLKSDAATLQKERQAGKSWLDIAIAKGVTEQQLLDALTQSMNEMHAQMQQQFPQNNTAQMQDWMSQEFAQDIKTAQYGTMTDMHVFGMTGNYGMMGGMMNGWDGNNSNNNYPGMMGGMMHGGMMHGWNGSNGYGGMMNGGMMHGWNNAPAVNATPVPSTQKVDREIKINAKNFQFDTPAVNVKKGETIKFSFTNQDNFAHNVISQDGKLAYTFLPANQTTTVLWTAPAQAGTYEFICTFHPNMEFKVTVE